MKRYKRLLAGVLSVAMAVSALAGLSLSVSAGGGAAWAIVRKVEAKDFTDTDRPDAQAIEGNIQAVRELSDHGSLMGSVLDVDKSKLKNVKIDGVEAPFIPVLLNCEDPEIYGITDISKVGLVGGAANQLNAVIDHDHVAAYGGDPSKDTLLWLDASKTPGWVELTYEGDDYGGYYFAIADSSIPFLPVSARKAEHDSPEANAVKNVVYANGRLVIIAETEGMDHTGEIPVLLDFGVDPEQVDWFGKYIGDKDTNNADAAYDAKGTEFLFWVSVSNTSSEGASGRFYNEKTGASSELFVNMIAPGKAAPSAATVSEKLDLTNSQVKEFADEFMKCSTLDGYNVVSGDALEKAASEKLKAEMAKGGVLTMKYELADVAFDSDGKPVSMTLDIAPIFCPANDDQFVKVGNDMLNGQKIGIEMILPDSLAQGFDAVNVKHILSDGSVEEFKDLSLIETSDGYQSVSLSVSSFSQFEVTMVQDDEETPGKPTDPGDSNNPEEPADPSKPADPEDPADPSDPDQPEKPGAELPGGKDDDNPVTGVAGIAVGTLALAMAAAGVMAVSKKRRS